MVLAICSGWSVGFFEIQLRSSKVFWVFLLFVLIPAGL